MLTTTLFNTLSQHESFVERQTDSLQQLCHDLENLLNAKIIECSESVSARDYSSIIRYGLPDITQFNFDDQRDKQKFCQYIEDAIERHEPRLTDVTVAGLSDSEESLSWHFKITATVQLNAEALPSALQTRFNLVNLSCNIREM